MVVSGHVSKLFEDRTQVSVAPTQTTFIDFQVIPLGGYATPRPTACWLTIENADAAQTLDVLIQTRIKNGSGTFNTVSAFAMFQGIVALELRTDFLSTVGLDEIRVVGTASGAGLTAFISRRMAWPV